MEIGRGNFTGKNLVPKSEVKMPPKTIIPVVLAGIVRKNKILLLKRSREPFKGLWSLPGGKIGPYEVITDALKREVLEETNLNPISMKFAGIVSELIIEGNKIKKSHLINVFLVEATRTKVRPSSEGKLKWLTFTEIKELKNEIIPTDFLIISKMLLKRGKQAYLCFIEYKDKEYILRKYGRI